MKTMNTVSKTRNTTATLAPKRSAKRVVLAGRFALAAKVADEFRKLGWEVHTVTADHDVHAAAAETDPHAILLPEIAGAESGYLACAKLLRTSTRRRRVQTCGLWSPQTTAYLPARKTFRATGASLPFRPTWTC